VVVVVVVVVLVVICSGLFFPALCKKTLCLQLHIG